MTTPAKTDAAAVEWAEGVMYVEGLVEHGWSLEFTPNNTGVHGSEGITLQDSKTIIVHWETGQPSHALLLHEIAHALMGRGGHDSHTFHEFQRLVATYMTPVPYQRLAEAKDNADGNR